MKSIQLIALDMDGTLLNSRNQISETDQQMIKKATEAGIEVIVATGRSYESIFSDLLTSLGIRYAITLNGAATYRLPEKECLFDECMPGDLICSIFKDLEDKEIIFDIFADGIGYSQADRRYLYDRLNCSEHIRNHLKTSRTTIDSIPEFIEENRPSIHKCTLNFCYLPDGTYQHRDEVAEYISQYPEITHVCGGFHNIECTKAGVSKASALKKLIQMLNIPLEATMACGDTENDLDILHTAGISVAMANADAEVKEASDYVTFSNDEDGVAHAIEHFIFKT